LANRKGKGKYMGERREYDWESAGIYVNINEFTHSHILDKQQTTATTNWPKAAIIGRGNNKPPDTKIRNTGLNKCDLRTGTKCSR